MSGYFKSEADKSVPGKRAGVDRTPVMANPLGGPVFVAGAERGDTLVVHIEDILVADYSWIAIGPQRGPLGQSTRWPELSKDYTTKILRHTPGASGTMRDGTVHFNDRIAWPVTPFVGTLGTAPDREVWTSFDGQGEWGGNLDIRDVAMDNKIFCPCTMLAGVFIWAMCTPAKAILSLRARLRRSAPQSSCTLSC